MQNTIGETRALPGMLPHGGFGTSVLRFLCLFGASPNFNNYYNSAFIFPSGFRYKPFVMSEPELSPEEKEFAEQLESLASEAQQHLEGKRVPSKPETLPEKAPSKSTKRQDLDSKQTLSLLQAIKPLVMGIEALSRATTENSATLAKLQEAAALQAKLPDMLTGIQVILDEKNLINQKLFDSLHGELKSYKDNFLLEVFHKPIVRDLITLYDDLSGIWHQNASIEGEMHSLEDLSEKSRALLARMGTFNANLDHCLASLVEVMTRMDVHIQPATTGKLNKTKHRAVAVETTEAREEDNDIVRTVKQGVVWRDRIFRPEEVVIKKWKEGYLIELSPTPSQ